MGHNNFSKIINNFESDHHIQNTNGGGGGGGEGKQLIIAYAHTCIVVSFIAIFYEISNLIETRYAL